MLFSYIYRQLYGVIYYTTEEQPHNIMHFTKLSHSASHCKLNIQTGMNQINGKGILLPNYFL